MGDAGMYDGGSRYSDDLDNEDSGSGRKVNGGGCEGNDTVDPSDEDDDDGDYEYKPVLLPAVRSMTTCHAASKVPGAFAAEMTRSPGEGLRSRKYRHGPTRLVTRVSCLRVCYTQCHTMLLKLHDAALYDAIKSLNLSVAHLSLLAIVSMNASLHSLSKSPAIRPGEWAMHYSTRSSSGFRNSRTHRPTALSRPTPSSASSAPLWIISATSNLASTRWGDTMFVGVFANPFAHMLCFAGLSGPQTGPCACAMVLV